MSAHTPGPWRVGINQRGGAHIVSDEHGLIGETVGGGNCGLQLNEGGKAQSLVNARLIAAAPDMLEALRDLYTECDAMQHEELDSDPTWGPLMRAAAAALAKAVQA